MTGKARPPRQRKTEVEGLADRAQQEDEFATQLAALDITEDRVVPVLALTVMHKMNQDAWHTGMTLAKSYQRSYAREVVKNKIIRLRLDQLLSGPYMPMPDRILAALNVWEEDIDRAVRTDYDYRLIMGTNEIGEDA